jgi:transposase
MQTTRTIDSSSSEGVLYLSLELAKVNWKLGITDGLNRRPRIREIAAGSAVQLEFEIRAAKAKFGLPKDAPVVTCYEAGRDGFWIHRWLTSLGIVNYVIDPASIEVNRRMRRVKTDVVDAERMVMALIRLQMGDRNACRAVNVPGPQDEDARQLHRELDCLTKERTAHINRIKGLLFAQGIRIEEINESFATWLLNLKTGDGQQQPCELQQRVLREFERLQLVARQMRGLEKNRAELYRRAMRAQQEQSQQEQQEQQDEQEQQEQQTPQPEIPTWLVIAEHLRVLRGIGEHASLMLSTELFAWRELQNRRQVAALAGLTPSPWQSGGTVDDEQGISKAGRGPLRCLLIEIAWGWIRFQPDSALTKWFMERFAKGNSRQRRIGIVALARKLLVALWKYVNQGLIPEGAQFTKKLNQFRYTRSLG